MEGFRAGFRADPKNLLAQNVVARACPLESSFKRETLHNTVHVFSHKVDEIKPITNQKSTGRCWLFACLNAMRIAFAKSKNIDADFEFSQNYLFFWDKVERCNYFLNAMVDVARRREPRELPDGRLMSFLLKNPTNDGGQWDMVVNLIEKHGVMPKKCFPETHSSEASLKMNRLLKSKLREYAAEIDRMVNVKECDNATVEKRISEEMMPTIFRMVGICLGVPPESFTWNYYDKSKKCNTVAEVSPLQFYEEHVKPAFDVKKKICLVSDPRPENPYGKLYSVEFLGNVVGGKRTVYNNQPIETLMKIASESLTKRQEPVWFGADIGKNFAVKQGIADVKAHDFELLFGTNINDSSKMDKAKRLVYGESEMTHAMVITGVHLEGEEATRWRVENSWGDDRQEKGYLMMTSQWFKEYVYEVVVDESLVPDEIKNVGGDVKVLPAWDPMGALA